MLPDVSVYVNGRPLPAAALPDLRSVTVQEDLRALSMFTLELHNWDDEKLRVSWSDSPEFAVGNEVQISLGYVGDLHKVMVAEITSLEPVFTAGEQSVLMVRGYDLRHRLLRGQKSRTFLHTKDSEIVVQIARESGLKWKADDSQIVYDYVIQSNETNLGFLQRRSSLNGYEVFVRNKTLYFRRPKFADPPASRLSLGEHITEFSPRLSTLYQPSAVTVRAWDIMKKEVVIATAEYLPYTGGEVSGPDQARRAFGAADVTLAGQPASNLGEATSIAQAEFSTEALAFVEGDVVAFGRPQLLAGTVVDISGAGERFSGRYYITSVTHTVTPENGYQTSFTVQRNAT
jgi:phage protein D